MYKYRRTENHCQDDKTIAVLAILRVSWTTNKVDTKAISNGGRGNYKHTSYRHAVRER